MRLVPSPIHPLPQRAYSLFRLGHDTHDIARQLSQPESAVLRWITKRRSEEMGLPNPYQHERQKARRV
jgi:hypothetical protein